MVRFRSGWLVLLALALVLGGCKKKDDQGIEATAPLALPSGEGVPEEVLGYFLVGNPTELISQMEKLGSKVGPVPPGTVHALIVQSLLKLGFKDTSVIDLRGPAGILILNPKTHAVPVVAAYTTTGKDKVLESVKPVWKQKGETDGALEMVREEVDTYEVFEGGAPAAPKASMTMYLKFEGKTMYAARDAQALQAGLPQLKKAMASSTPQKGALGIFMVNHLRKAYQMELAIIPETIKAQVMADPSFAQAGTDPKLMQWMVGWMIDKLVACVNQTRHVSFTADFAEDGAVFQMGMAAEQDSFFQKLLAAQKRTGKPLKLMSALPEGHFLAVGLNVQWQMFKDDLLAFTTEIMKVFMGTEPSKEYVDAMLAMWEVMGDEVAVSEDISPNGISVVELIEVKDEAKAREVFAKVMKLTAELFAKNEEGLMGMKFGFEGPTNLEEYQGAKLEAIDMTWDLSSMPPAQAQMLKAFYGDKLRMIMAFVGGNLALTMGKQAEADMRALIDRLKGKSAGLGASPAFQNAAGGLDQGAGGVMYMSIARLIAASAESTYAAMGKPAPQIKLPAASSGMFLRFSSTPQMLTTTLRLPAQHLAELGAAIKGMMQTSMDR